MNRTKLIVKIKKNRVVDKWELVCISHDYLLRTAIGHNFNNTIRTFRDKHVRMKPFYTNTLYEVVNIDELNYEEQMEILNDAMYEIPAIYPEYTEQWRKQYNEYNN